MTEEKYKEIASFLSDRNLTDFDTLYKAYKEIDSIKEISTNDKDKYLVISEVLDALQKERVIKERNIWKFIKNLTDEELEDFQVALEKQLEDAKAYKKELEDELAGYGIDAEDLVEEKKKSSRWWSVIYLFLALMWMITIPLNTEDIFIGALLSIIPAGFLRKSHEYLKESL